MRQIMTFESLYNFCWVVRLSAREGAVGTCLITLGRDKSVTQRRDSCNNPPKKTKFEFQNRKEKRTTTNQVDYMFHETTDSGNSLSFKKLNKNVNSSGNTHTLRTGANT